MATTKTTKKEVSLDAVLYTTEGTKNGTFTLPQEVFGLPWNGDLVHQVAVALAANARPTVAHTKDRGEVAGGGKKPWKQKGTGRARHGSTRSPIWRHGGVTFGPRSEKDYSQKINRKMRTKAIYTALSQKLRDGELLFVSDMSLSNIKTKDAQAVLTTMSKIEGFSTIAHKRKNRALLLLAGRETVIEKSFANLPGVECEQVKDLNLLDILNHRYIVIPAPEKAVAILQAKSV